MDFSNLDWGFLISMASAMLATTKIVLTVYNSSKETNKRAKLEHHELFRLFKNLKHQLKHHPDISNDLKKALIELMDVTDNSWKSSGILKQLTSESLSKNDIQTAFSDFYIDFLEKLEIKLEKSNVEKKYITHILNCIRSYGTNFRGEVDYIIFSDAHKDRYQMVVMLLDMNTAIVTSAMPELMSIGDNNENN